MPYPTSAILEYALSSTSEGKTLSRRLSIALILAVAMLAHWPALISDSLMWDDWIVLAWFTQDRPDWSFKFYQFYGLTPFYLSDWPFFVMGLSAAGSVLLAKIAYVVGVMASGILVMLISERVAHGSQLFAVMAGVFAVCYPALSGEGFHISMLKYFIFIPLFLAGMLIFVREATSPKHRWSVRALAYCALLLSFTLNSLLVLFYALLPAVLYASMQRAECRWAVWLASARTFVFRHLDFLVLPVIYWVLKEILMPRTGVYTRYNRISLHAADLLGIFKAYVRLGANVLQTNLFAPLSIQLGAALAAMAFVVVAIMGRRLAASLASDEHLTRRHLAILFVLGVLALAGAAFPYFAVGRRAFIAFGFQSRDQVLFPLSVSWMTSALFCLLLIHAPSGGKAIRVPRFQWRQIALGAFAGFVTLQCVSNWRNHADWQAHYAYYRSAVEKIGRDDLVRQASVIYVSDLLPGDRTLQGFRYPTSIWTEIISAAFQNHTTRFAIPFPPENGRFYIRDEISQRVRETEVDFMLDQIDLGGQQIRLTVEPGSGARTTIRLALAYWRARFFVPADMPKLLASLTRVKSEPIGRE